MFEVKKEFLDELEFLPQVVNTPLWKFINPEAYIKVKKADKQAALLYEAIAKRENHYQWNTPPAHGDPEYRYLCGIVRGILLVMDVYEEEVNGQIIIRKEHSNKKILIVDKPKRPKSYYDSVRENNDLLRSLGL